MPAYDGPIGGKAVVNIVRLYLHPLPGVPESMRAEHYPVVIDCKPTDAHHIKRRFKRQGYEVIEVPL